MAIDRHRRAKLAALITTLAPEQVQALKAQVQTSCGHPYAELQTHAWALCGCPDEACPAWVEKGFAAAELFGVSSKHRPTSSASNTPPAAIEDVLGATAAEMTGLFRDVVLDASEIKSSTEAEEGDVFADPVPKK